MTITRAAVTEAKSLDKRSRALANLTMTIAGGFTIGAGELFVYTSDAFDRNRIENAKFLSIASATFERLVSTWRLMTTNNGTCRSTYLRSNFINRAIFTEGLTL